LFRVRLLDTSKLTSNVYVVLTSNRAESAAIAITTTDLVSKSVAIQTKVHVFRNTLRITCRTTLRWLVKGNQARGFARSFVLCE
jgi:hypothetical protein